MARPPHGQLGPAQAEILRAVAAAGDPVTVAQVAEALGVGGPSTGSAHARVRRALGALERRGMVHIWRDAIIGLTATGAAVGNVVEATDKGREALRVLAPSAKNDS